MRERNGTAPIGLIGLIAVAVTTAGFFLLNIERTTVNVWALIFLLLSECVFSGGLIGLQFSNALHSKAFLKAGTTAALSLYFIVTLLSVLFAGKFSEKLNKFILI
jgi:hypothetical protein